MIVREDPNDQCYPYTRPASSDVTTSTLLVHVSTKLISVYNKLLASETSFLGHAGIMS